MNSRLRRHLKVMTGRLARLGLGNHPGLLIRPGQEGYRDYAFGGRAGPQVSWVNLFHELAHAAEFGGSEFRRRASEHGYHLYVPQR